MEPQRCRIVAATSAADEDDGCVVLWGNASDPDDARLRVHVDAVVPRDTLRRALLSMECSNYDLPVAHVKWQRFQGRAALQVLYDTLLAHGIPVHPDRAEALRPQPPFGGNRWWGGAALVDGTSCTHHRRRRRSARPW